MTPTISTTSQQAFFAVVICSLMAILFAYLSKETEDKDYHDIFMLISTAFIVCLLAILCLTAANIYSETVAVFSYIFGAGGIKVVGKITTKDEDEDISESDAAIIRDALIEYYMILSTNRLLTINKMGDLLTRIKELKYVFKSAAMMIMFILLSSCTPSITEPVEDSVVPPIVDDSIYTGDREHIEPNSVRHSMRVDESFGLYEDVLLCLYSTHLDSMDFLDESEPFYNLRPDAYKLFLNLNDSILIVNDEYKTPISLKGSIVVHFEINGKWYR